MDDSLVATLRFHDEHLCTRALMQSFAQYKLRQQLPGASSAVHQNVPSSYVPNCSAACPNSEVDPVSKLQA
jgi:hypothetical protein